MNPSGLFALALGAILVNNLVLARFLGLCPLVVNTRRLEPALAMGVVVVAVMTASSALCYGLDRYLLAPLGLGYLRIVALVAVIAATGHLARVVAARLAPVHHRAIGAAYPMVTTNCAVLGIALLSREAGYGGLAATVHGFSAGLGFALVSLLLAGLRERLDLAPVPEALKDVPIILIVAGLMAMAFSGFSGMIET